MQRVPYILVAGDQEQADGTVNVRARSGENLGNFTLEELVELFTNDIANLGRVVEHKAE